MARVSALEFRYAHAARLFGAVEVLREVLGLPLPPSEQDKYERDLEVARGDMEPLEFQAYWNEGRKMDLKSAIDCALTGA